MKWIKLLCLLLVIVIVLPVFVACNNEATQKPKETEASDGDQTDIVGIPERNYNTDFTIKSQSGEIFEKYYWSEDYKRSSSIEIANYERELAIEEHLGIEIFHESFNDIKEIFADIERLQLAGLDEYQLALTHCYGSVTKLMTTNYVLDLSEVPGISLNDEYWNTEIMESVKFQGHMYLGSSSFIIHRPTFILFNKTMADAYSDIGSETLYNHVRDKTWTIDQLQTYASMVDVSLNETLADPMEGTYGMMSYIDWELCSFITASGYIHASINEDGNFQIQGFNERIFDIFKKVVGLTEAEYFYGWNYGEESKALKMSCGRVLFAAVSVEMMISEMLSSDVLLGVLPYPTMEEGKIAQNLDWAGYFVIPSTVTNQQMSGEVAELLSYYGETEIKHEFYDVLLGLRASKCPEDQEMLDLIFDNLVVDPILPMCDLGEGVQAIFYSTPWMIKTGQKAMRSWYSKYYSSATELIKQING